MQEIMANIRSLKKILSEYDSEPIEVVGTVLNMWCESSYPALGKLRLPTIKSLEKDDRIHELLRTLKNLPFIDAIYWLSSAYALFTEDGYRKELAIYFTPPSITNRLLTELENEGVDFSNGTVFDPACGGAAFLAPLAIRIRDSLKQKGYTAKKIISHIEKNLFGMELDDNLCILSNQFLKMALYDEVKSLDKVPIFDLSVGNSLIELSEHSRKADILICNPPYRKLSRYEKEIYDDKYGEIIEGQSNYYGLFISLCINLLKENGVCALVTPTSLLSGRSFSKLRTFIKREAQVLSIGMVSERTGVFIDALQETSLTILRRKTKNSSSLKKTNISIVSHSGSYTEVGSCLLPNSGASWPIPRIEEDVSLLNKVIDSKARIKDYGYKIRIGSFVWNRDIQPVYWSAQEVRQHKVKTAVPLLWSSDIKSGIDIKFTGKEKSNGEPCFVDYGSKLHPSLVKKKCLILQRVTSNGQPRRLVASAVPNILFDAHGGFVGENHTIILEQTVAKPILTTRQMARLLTVDIIDRLYRCISGVTNVSAFELNQLPLPDPILLKKHLAAGNSIEAATSKSFSLNIVADSDSGNNLHI